MKEKYVTIRMNNIVFKVAENLMPLLKWLDKKGFFKYYMHIIEVTEFSENGEMKGKEN